MELGDLLYLALGDDNRKLRAEYPELFFRVDLIKQRSDWQAFAGKFFPTQMYDYLSWEECEWCGENFASDRRDHGRFCSRPHYLAFYAWKKRRAS